LRLSEEDLDASPAFKAFVRMHKRNMRAIDRWSAPFFNFIERHAYEVWAFLFGLAFVISLFVPEPIYALTLSFWFFMWLSAFHAIYSRGVTTAGMRKIDYWYLSAGALGVLFFAIQYSDQRDDYLKLAFKRYVQERAWTARADVANDHSSYKFFACRVLEAEAYAEPHCKKAGELGDQIGDPYEAKHGAFESAFTDFEDFLSGREGLGDRENTTDRDKEELSRLVALLRLRLASGLSIIREDERAPIPPATRAPRNLNLVEALLGVGQTLLWPFLIALALALRLTKVTIELKRWTQD
jgi:hypothetical protein